MKQQRGKIDVHGLSIRGSEHARNQDHFAIAELAKSMRLHQTNLSIDDDTRVHGRSQGQVYLIADGLNEGPAPSRASSEAVDRIVQYFLNEMPWLHLADGRPADVTLALKEAVCNAQADLMLGHPDREGGVVTTLTLAFVSWPDLHVVHLGKSRCYVVRNGMLRQLTTEHRIEGLGAQEPEVQRFSLAVGDVLALCSDGAAEGRTPAGILDVLSSPKDAEWMCGELVNASARDDQTAIVVRFMPHEPVHDAATQAEPTPALDARRDEPRHPRPAVKTPRHRPGPDHPRPFSLVG